MRRVRAVILSLAAAVPVAVSAGGCGGRPPVPKRLVVERDLEGWKYRRFQGPLLDVEVCVEGNKGEAYSASYITSAADSRGTIADKDLVNVTVTRYERPDGVVRETVKLVRRLAQENGYQVEEVKIEGVRALSIVGPGEAWVMWPSARHVVKIGGQGRTSVPSSLVEDYGDRYPSKLPGGSLEGPLPPGPDSGPTKQDTPDESYDAANPKANLDNYDPDRVKIPDSKINTEATPTDVPARDGAAPAKPPTKKPRR